MAHDSLAIRFVVVLALAVIILAVMTFAAPPYPANGTAAPIPSSDPIYRAQYLNLYYAQMRLHWRPRSVNRQKGGGGCRPRLVLGFAAAAAGPIPKLGR